MISRERLEELIDKEATIWAVYDEDRMERIKLVVRMMGVSVEEYNKIHNCEPMLYSQFCGIVRDICPISWLFETEEEAVFYKEFGCIERTERLKLPTWEEVLKKIQDKEGYVELVFNHIIILEIEVSKILKSRIYVSCQSDGMGYEEVYRAELTKENYTLACRKCKELFLGGSDGDIR